MKLKHRFTAVIAALVIATITPVSALASVKLKVSDTSRIYDKTEVFDTYLELKSTGYGLVKNSATLMLTLNNGNFAKTKDGDFFPVYVTTSHEQLDRGDIQKSLVDGNISGFGIIPTDDTNVIIKLPESMIDGYAQIMLSATAEEYGSVSISIRNNRDVKFILDTGDIEENIPEKKDEKTMVYIPIGSNIIYVGDEQLELDVPAFISNEVTKIPLRAVAEIFGADVYWNNAEKSATIEIGDDVFYLKAGSRVMYVNGFAVPLLAGPEISNGRMFVPLRDIAQMLGLEDLRWDDITKSVIFELTEYDGHTSLTYEQHK